MEADARYAKAMGLTGKASISPRHVEIINRVFSPTLAEIDYAYEVMEAIRIGKEQGKGAVALRGKMIDAPIVARAQQTIAMAEALGMSLPGSALIPAVYAERERSSFAAGQAIVDLCRKGITARQILTPEAIRQTAGFVLKNSEDIAVLEQTQQEEGHTCHCHGSCGGHHHG